MELIIDDAFSIMRVNDGDILIKLDGLLKKLTANEWILIMAAVSHSSNGKDIFKKATDLCLGKRI